MPSPAAPFANDSNNANTDKRAGRPPLASAWKYFHPTPNVLSCKSQKRPSCLRSHTRRPRRESGDVGKSSPPCTLRTTAEHLRGEGGRCLFLNCRRSGETSSRRTASTAGGAPRGSENSPGLGPPATGGERSRARPSGGERAEGRRPRAGAAGLGRPARRPPGGGSARPPASRPPAEATSRLGSRSTGSAFFPRAGSQGAARAARGGPSPSRQLRGEREAGPRPAPSPRGPPRAAPRRAGQGRGPPRAGRGARRGGCGRAGRPGALPEAVYQLPA